MRGNSASASGGWAGRLRRPTADGRRGARAVWRRGARGHLTRTGERRGAHAMGVGRGTPWRRGASSSGRRRATRTRRCRGGRSCGARGRRGVPRGRRRGAPTSRRRGATVASERRGRRGVGTSGGRGAPTSGQRSATRRRGRRSGGWRRAACHRPSALTRGRPGTLASPWRRSAPRDRRRGAFAIRGGAPLGAWRSAPTAVRLASRRGRALAPRRHGADGRCRRGGPCGARAPAHLRGGLARRHGGRISDSWRCRRGGRQRCGTSGRRHGAPAAWRTVAKGGRGGRRLSVRIVHGLENTGSQRR